jgi:hypothetical protein
MSSDQINMEAMLMRFGRHPGKVQPNLPAGNVSDECHPDAK